jgi:sugar lactone lactonase YvrE
VDPDDRLWLLDTGSIEFGPVLPCGAKLVGVDLRSNKVVRTIPFPRDVVRPNSYTNDIRFDLSRGTQGMAYLTDSSVKGDNGLIVVDVASGKSWRRLDKHPSTLPEQGFTPVVEGEPLKERPPTGGEKPVTFGSDGIAIPSGGKLYYCPLAGHHLYSVNLDALSDPNNTDDQVAATVEDLGDRGFASDGLDGDAQGRLYLTDYEHNAVRRRDASGQMTILVQDPRLIWPDSMAIAPDGYVYVTANQLNRQAKFHKGQDLRQKPYALFRFKTDAKPVRQPTPPAGSATRR